jgi:hypothetical protein
MKIQLSTPKLLASSLVALMASSALTACASKTTYGPVTYLGPTTITTSHPIASPTPRVKTCAHPTPTPDPLAPEPIPQKPNIPGVSPLNHGADQPLYHSTQ